MAVFVCFQVPQSSHLVSSESNKLPESTTNVQLMLILVGCLVHTRLTGVSSIALTVYNEDVRIWVRRENIGRDTSLLKYSIGEVIEDSLHKYMDHCKQHYTRHSLFTLMNHHLSTRLHYW